MSLILRRSTNQQMDSQRTREALGDYLRRRREEEGGRPTACGTAGRGSFAGNCSRKIAFEMLEVEETDPIDENTLVAFRVGQDLHDLLQEAMVEEYGMRIEQPVDLRPYGYDISGHIDGIYNDLQSADGAELVWELKSKTSFGFKMARKSFEPEKTDVAQVAMYSLGVPEARGIHLVYMCKDADYKWGDSTRAGETLEWIVGLDEPCPGQDGLTPRQIGVAEATRIDAIAAEALQWGLLPERFIPGEGVVDFVPAPDSRDKPWQCRYCQWNALCASLPSTQTPIDNIFLRRKQ